MQNLLKNISLKAKLQLLTLLPILGLLYFIFLLMFSSFTQMQNMSHLSNLIKISDEITHLVNKQREERTITANFIRYNGEEFSKELSNKRKSIDQLYIKLNAHIKNSDINNKIKNNLIKKIAPIKKNLDTVRYQIRKENIHNTRIVNALNFYTLTNMSLLEVLLELSHYSDDSSITEQIIAMYNLLTAEDDTDLIRSYGINLIDLINKFEDDDENEQLVKEILYNQLRLKSLLSTENLKLNTYLKIASAKERAFYDKEVKKAKLNDYNEFIRSLSNDEDLDLFAGEDDTFLKLATKKVLFLEKITATFTVSLQKNIHNLETRATSSFLTSAIIAFIILLSTLTFAYLIYKRIDSDMRLLKRNLIDFFDYISKKKEDIDINNVDGKDEFSILINTINNEVIKAKEVAQKDNIVLKEIDSVIHRVENGFFTYTVKEEAGSDTVKILKQSINNMINITRKKLDTLGLIFDAYGKYEYDFKLNEEQRKGMAGNIGTLSTSLQALGDDISIFMATFSNTVDELNQNTRTMLTTSSSLSNSSNIQASSLEETAASIEEITNTIQSNANSVLEMSQLSDKLKETADEGNKLANDTSISMGEISGKVNQIKDAISIIDQISFQTNILSLNAAVEAATAGEAGKGFAVVAQEVRNLAARSAEAANEIKTLVDDANEKAQQGQTVSNNMINGYENLSKRIIQTKTIIDNVAEASQNQRDRIIQINESISQLDQMTQNNASNASDLNNISNQVESLSNQIEDIINKAQFNEEYKKMTCEADLATAIAGYKRDHIAFKTSNFARLNEFSSFQVESCQESPLGRWIIEQEMNSKAFTSTKEWNNLKQAHEKVHQSVQTYIDDNATSKDKSILEQDALNIENNTLEVFDRLNDILKVHCKN